MTTLEKLDRLYNSLDALLSSREDDHRIMRIRNNFARRGTVTVEDAAFVREMYAFNFEFRKAA